MKTIRIADANPYEAAKHFGCSTLRLHGLEQSPTQNFSVGLSHFLPAGGAEMSSTPLEKVYVVLSGEVTVVTETETVTLGPLDSCYLAPSEARAVENRTKLPASMLVIMPLPPKA